MTYGVVSILDDEHSDKVEKLWDTFQQEFGIHGVFHTPIPHFSYHVAEQYDLAGIEKIVAKLASEITPFEVKTTGLGIFTGDDPVLFVPVVRTAALEQIHERVWQAINDEDVVTGAFSYYELPQWVPHITLTHKDAGHDLLPQVVQFLSQHNFTWNIKIDNLSIIGGDEIHERIVEFSLRGK